MAEQLNKEKKILVELDRDDVKVLQKALYWSDVGLKRVKQKERSFLDTQNFITKKQEERLKTIKSILSYGGLATTKSGYYLDKEAGYLKGKIK